MDPKDHAPSPSHAGLRASAIGLALAILVVVPVVVVVFPGPGGHANPVGETALAPPEATPALLARGQALWTRQCAACHGESGRGDGKAAWLLNPKPRDFSLLRFRLISTDNRMPSDADLFRAITRGMPGSAMPSWAHFAVEDRWALVYTVRRLMREGKIARLLEEETDLERARAEEITERLTRQGQPVAIPAEDPALVDLERGKRVYTNTCLPCHDADGRGRKKRDLKDDNDFPIFARDFTQGIFKGGSTSEDLARRLLAGMPGTPMPSFKDALADPADLWSVIHYVQQFVQPGAQERVEQRTLHLTVSRVLDEQIADPAATAWTRVHATFVPLMPLWWRDERVEGVEVRALRNAGKIAIRLSWRDETKNDQALEQAAFGDGASVQFFQGGDPPFFGMGAKGEPVNVWSWKAAWEADLAGFRDIHDAHPGMAVDYYQSLQDPPKGRHSPPGEFPTDQHDPTFLTGWGAGNVVSHPKRTSSVEDLNAQGFGTLHNQGKGAQSVAGRGRWESGEWSVVFVRDLPASDAGDIFLRSGDTLSVAFAVWDGAAGDRNGQKAVSIWHRLSLGE